MRRSTTCQSEKNDMLAAPTTIDNSHRLPVTGLPFEIVSVEAAAERRTQPAWFKFAGHEFVIVFAGTPRP
jgi:hypothetical protein